MIFHDLGVPKTRLKSISKSMPKTNRYWTLSEPYFGYMASRAGFLRAQAVSKSSLEELPKPPAFARCLQERFDGQDSTLLRFLGAL